MSFWAFWGGADRSDKLEDVLQENCSSVSRLFTVVAQQLIPRGSIYFTRGKERGKTWEKGW